MMMFIKASSHYIILWIFIIIIKGLILFLLIKILLISGCDSASK